MGYFASTGAWKLRSGRGSCGYRAKTSDRQVAEVKSLHMDAVVNLNRSRVEEVMRFPINAVREYFLKYIY